MIIKGKDFPHCKIKICICTPFKSFERSVVIFICNYCLSICFCHRRTGPKISGGARILFCPTIEVSLNLPECLMLLKQHGNYIF